MTHQNRALEDWLRTNGDSVFDQTSAESPHLNDARLAAALEARKALSKAELRHLAACRECRSVAAELALAGIHRPTRRVRPVMSMAGLAAAAAALALVVWRPEPMSDGLRARGGEAIQSASVTLVATSKAGHRRDIRDGDEVHLGERLGFRYGNPAGKHRTLTVLAWDGSKVFWFYPEDEDGVPQPIDAGPAAVNRRLPFDIVLDSTHRLGPLTVVAAFDTDPKAIVRSLKAGGRSRVPHAWTFHLRVGPDR